MDEQGPKPLCETQNLCLQNKRHDAAAARRPTPAVPAASANGPRKRCVPRANKTHRVLL